MGCVRPHPRHVASWSIAGAAAAGCAAAPPRCVVLLMQACRGPPPQRTNARAPPPPERPRCAPPQPPLTPAPHPAAAATLTGDYLLMLVAMTFNVGLFAAVIAGFAAGALLFGHNAQRAVAGGALLGPRDAPCCSNT